MRLGATTSAQDASADVADLSSRSMCGRETESYNRHRFWPAFLALRYNGPLPVLKPGVLRLIRWSCPPLGLVAGHSGRLSIYKV
jgi:hypothetical protein